MVIFLDLQLSTAAGKVMFGMLSVLELNLCGILLVNLPWLS